MEKALRILQFIPAIVELIKVVETQLWPEGTGNGKDKLEAVREILTATYDGISEIWPMLEKVIAIVVAVLNKTGIFKK